MEVFDNEYLQYTSAILFYQGRCKLFMIGGGEGTVKAIGNCETAARFGCSSPYFLLPHWALSPFSRFSSLYSRSTILT